MPHRTAPLTFFLDIAPMAKTVMIVSRIGNSCAQVTPPVNTLSEVKLTSVEALPTTIPAFCMPMKAMNRPIPAEMATLTACGMASKMILRRPVTVSRTKTIPSTRTMTSALAYVSPMPTQIV